MIYLRGLWKQKPKQWGPRVNVAANIMDVFNNVFGMPAPSALFALWEMSGVPQNVMTGEFGTLYGATKPVWGQGETGPELIWQADTTGYLFNTGVGNMTYGSNDLWSAFALATQGSGRIFTPIIGIGASGNAYQHTLRSGKYDNYLSDIVVDGDKTATTDVITVTDGPKQSAIGGSNFSASSRKAWLAYDHEIVTAENTDAATSRALVDRISIGITADSSPYGFQPSINFAVFWDNAGLSDDLFDALSENPYQIIQPPALKTYFIPSTSIPTIFNLMAALHTVKPTKVIQ